MSYILIKVSMHIDCKPTNLRLISLTQSVTLCCFFYLLIISYIFRLLNTHAHQKQQSKLSDIRCIFLNICISVINVRIYNNKYVYEKNMMRK